MTDTIVLGIDGATWDLLDPLMRSGRLPNLKALVDNGFRGRLTSTHPPITAPAWLSMATGQNPGKTGVFYFLNRTEPDSFDFEPAGVDDFRGRSFWDVLDAAGHSVGIFNFPMLSPPYGLNGFMVSGFGADEDAPLTAPASLESDLDAVTDGYEVDVPYAAPKYLNDPEGLARDLNRVLEKREAAIKHLLSEYALDVFFGVVSVTDWAQHYFWRFHDSSHVLHEPGHEDVLADIFARVDETIGSVREFARAEGATLLLVSDHGFGPVEGTFYTNEWLEEERFRVPASSGLFSQLRGEYFPYIRRVLEPVVGRIPLLGEVAEKAGRSFRQSPLDVVDTERSTAFAAKQGLTSGLIYTCTDDPTDRERVADALRNRCERAGLSVAIHWPEDIYHGPNVELGPDILFEIEGLAYAADPRYSTTDEVIVDRPPAKSRNGGHRREGIYALEGPDVESGEGPSRSLLDVAPTILALQEVPVPVEMDGEPMTDAFTTLTDPGTKPISELVSSTAETGRRDATDVRDQLEDLGYL